MKTSIFLMVALVATTGLLATACGTGETSNHLDGMHGTTRPAPATDLADTGNYRFRNQKADEQRGDTLPETVKDTAFQKKTRP